MNGSALASHRQALGLNQHELAIKVGVSQAMIARMEAGTKDPPLWLIKALARLFGCSIDELVAD